MGWTSFRLEPGKTTANVLRDEFKSENHWLTDVVVKGETAYCVSNRKQGYAVTGEDGTQSYPVEIEKSCLVVLIRRGGGQFAYKDLHECMQPYFYDCPASILDQLTETDDPGSLEWRAECRRQIAQRNRAAGVMDNLFAAAGL